MNPIEVPKDWQKVMLLCQSNPYEKGWPNIMSFNSTFVKKATFTYIEGSNPPRYRAEIIAPMISKDKKVINSIIVYETNNFMIPVEGEPLWTLEIEEGNKNAID